MTAVIATNQTILVVGGGSSGMTAAWEAAEGGKQVVLIEKGPTLGGRVSQLYKYFPKLCFPTCGLEINLRRIKANRNIHLLTMAEVEQVSGTPGDFSVTVRHHPRYVTEACTACGDCAKAVSAEFDDEFNYGMNRRKGAYLPYNLAYPQQYVLDGRVIGSPDADAAKAACKANAIDLDMKEEVITLKVGAIVWATGWKPYDAADQFGYDRFKNVITTGIRAYARPLARPAVIRPRTVRSQELLHPAPVRVIAITSSTARGSAAWPPSSRPPMSANSSVMPPSRAFTTSTSVPSTVSTTSIVG
ncbi:hypothetical protein CCP3SC15_2860003 [Gammaproteobacteria bacterium]